MEAKVFLLGIYRNYDELEENLSMPELLLTLETHAKEEFRHIKFNAALQGVELDDPFEKTVTLDDIRRRVAAKSIGVSPDDAVAVASEIGLGYEVI